MVRLLYYNIKNQDFIYSDSEESIYWVNNRIFKPIEYEEIDIIVSDETGEEWELAEFSYPSLQHLEFSLKMIKRNTPNIDKYKEMVKDFRLNASKWETNKIKEEYNFIIKEMTNATLDLDGQYKDEMIIMMNEVKGIFSRFGESTGWNRSLDSVMFNALTK